MDIPACLPDAAWCREVRLRVLTLWPLKALANSLGLALFFVAYFWVMRHPQAEVAVMPLTAVDGWFDFAPAAMPLYASLWLYLGLPIALLRTKRELRACGLAAEVAVDAGAALPPAAFLGLENDRVVTEQRSGRRSPRDLLARDEQSIELGGQRDRRELGRRHDEGARRRAHEVLVRVDGEAEWIAQTEGPDFLPDAGHPDKGIIRRNGIAPEAGTDVNA